MGKRGKIFYGTLTVMAVIMTGLLLLSRQYPGIVTSVYTRRLFPVITMPLRLLARLTPFSLGELVLVILLGTFIAGSIRRIIRSIRFGTWKPLVQGLRRLSGVFLIGIVIFPLLGGFNYSGSSFAKQAGYEISPASSIELEALCRSLGRKAGEVRNLLPQNEDGVVESPLTIFEILEEAQAGYDVIGKVYPWLQGDYGTPKPALSSRLMSYLQISGIYPYYMPEAIVNCDTPMMSLPHTVCHEMAHQRGIAREDEANFVAYLAAVSNPEPIFQYSGYLSAFIYSMNALYRVNPEGWLAIRKETHSGIIRDMIYIDQVWSSYTTPGDVVGQLSQTVNDLYLKGNAVEDGVQSYGRMVDLLIAQWRDSQIG